MSKALLGPVCLAVISCVIAGVYVWGMKLTVEQPKVPEAQVVPETKVAAPSAERPPAGTAQAIFGGGCFWCTEAVFQQSQGREIGGVGLYRRLGEKPDLPAGLQRARPVMPRQFKSRYDPIADFLRRICSKFSGRLTTRPHRISRATTSDPSTVRRSSITTTSKRQLAEHYKQKLDASGIFSAPIVTEIVPFTEFYRAERYHQNYYNQNASQPYCRAIIRPKLDKLKELFSDKLTNAAER